jgi:hypothetical protein
MPAEWRGGTASAAGALLSRVFRLGSPATLCSQHFPAPVKLAGKEVHLGRSVKPPSGMCLPLMQARRPERAALGSRAEGVGTVAPAGWRAQR